MVVSVDDFFAAEQPGKDFENGSSRIEVFVETFRKQYLPGGDLLILLSLACIFTTVCHYVQQLSGGILLILVYCILFMQTIIIWSYTTFDRWRHDCAGDLRWYCCTVGEEHSPGYRYYYIIRKGCYLDIIVCRSSVVLFYTYKHLTVRYSNTDLLL